MSMQTIDRFSSIIDGYGALLLDLWGVVHDGSRLYPGVREALEQFRKRDIRIVMVSNAPRRARKAEAVLAQLGVGRNLYDQVVTSGELGYRWLESGLCPWGRRYYYIGPAKDADVLDGLDFRRADDIKQCDFLLNVGFGSEEQSAADWQMLLRAAATLGVPMLCLNPDMEVVKITGERYACAGVLAADYERLGGRVTYFGKPFREIYEHCLALLAPMPRPKILAVGDGIATDIAGAAGFGLDAMLITGGILKKQEGEVEALCRKLNAVPRYLMAGLVW